MNLTLDRRRFLQGLTAMGAGFWLRPVAAPKAATPQPLLLSATAPRTGFAGGAAAAVPLQAHYVASLQPQLWLQDVLQQHAGQRLIGLMDNAGFILFETLALDAGVRFLVTGQHGHDHRFTTTAATAGVAAAIARQAGFAGNGVAVRERCCAAWDEESPTATVNPLPRLSDSLALTGACYARIAAGNWCAEPPAAFDGVDSDETAYPEPLVSFVVAV